jgi:hypothetical protein
MSEALIQPCADHSAEAPARPTRWRKPTASRPAIVRTSATDREICPVAELAAEAATVIRLQQALQPNRPDGDAALIAALDAPDDYVRADEMKSTAFERLQAIAEIASHRRAASLKGTVFQLYLAANAAEHPQGLIVTRLSVHDERELDRNDAKVRRLHHAAIAHLEAGVMDDDLRTLRSWYFSEAYDLHRTCERAIHDRDALRTEAQALGARDAARHEAAG